MRIFGFGKKRVKKGKRQPNAEQMSNIAEHKRRRYITDSFIEMANQDPEWRRQMVAEAYSLKLPTKDPAAEQQKELEALISDLAMKQLRENPELARQIVDARISQLVNQGDLATNGDGEEYRPDSGIGQVLGEIEDLEELKSRLGGGKSSAFADVFKDPQVITSLISTLQSFIKGVSPQAMETKIMVQVDGQSKTVTELEFQRLQMEGRVKPIAAIETTKPDQGPSTDEITPQVIAKDKPAEPVSDNVSGEPASYQDNQQQLPLIF